MSDCVVALVGWYGPYDVGPLVEPALPALSLPAAAITPALVEPLGGLQFFRCTPDGCPADVIAAGSPITHVSAGDPPTLLIHGMADTLAPPDQSMAIEARLRAAGVPVEAHYLDGAGHGWTAPDDIAASSAAARTALQLTFDFLTRRLAP